MLKSPVNSQALLLLDTWSISNRLIIYNLTPFLNKEYEFITSAEGECIVIAICHRCKNNQNLWVIR